MTTYIAIIIFSLATTAIRLAVTFLSPENCYSSYNYVVYVHVDVK